MPARAFHYTYAETEAMNPKAMNEMLEKYGVTNRRWTDEEPGCLREGMERSADRTVAGPGLQEGRRQLSRLARGVQAVGRGAFLKPTYLSQ